MLLVDEDSFQSCLGVVLCQERVGKHLQVSVFDVLVHIFNVNVVFGVIKLFILLLPEKLPQRVLSRFSSHWREPKKT